VATQGASSSAPRGEEQQLGEQQRQPNGAAQQAEGYHRESVSPKNKRKNFLTEKTMKRTTSKTIGMIPYSLTLRSSNPLDETAKKKIYPVAQRGQTVSLSQLAHHIREHGSTFSEGSIIGILTDMVECIKEQLLLGNFVNLDGLMRIFYTFTAKGVENADDFDSSMIEKVNLRADVDDEFVAVLNQKAKFVYVASRKEQAETKKAEKLSLNEEAGVVTNGSSGNDSGDSGSSGSVEE